MWDICSPNTRVILKGSHFLNESFINPTVDNHFKTLHLIK